ncbi:MAG: hypothetical protein IT227_04295 [Flavobacteriales bacterium]|nr:hypothetical protein [Flavobacteriales bacterium]
MVSSGFSCEQPTKAALEVLDDPVVRCAASSPTHREATLTFIIDRFDSFDAPIDSIE